MVLDIPPPYHLKIFGVPEMSDPAGRPIKLRTRKQLALLTYLALDARYRPVSRAKLVDLLWPDVPVQKGSHSLSQAFTAIRHALGQEALLTGPGTVRLAADVVTDLDLVEREFDQLPVDAEPLLEFDTCAGVEYAHWVDSVRARVGRKIREVLLNELRHYRREGKLDRVRERATALYDVDPYNDDAALALAETALVNDERSIAVELLQSHANSLRIDRGVEPSAEIARLLHQLKDGHQEPDRPLYQAARREEFVGRDSIISKLEAIWSDVRDDKSRSCLITGSPGIGKTSILNRFAATVAARQWPVFKVACHKMGRRVPYAAVADLLHNICAEPAVSGTEPLWLAEASRVVPELKSMYPGIPDPINIESDSVRFRVAEAIYRMLEAVAEGAPMLVALDDIQNLDDASRDVLFVLFRKLNSQAVLILTSASSPETGHVDPLDVTSTDTTERQHVLEIPPLDRQNSEELLGRLMGVSAKSSDTANGMDIQGRILQLSQGNPHLLEVLVLDWKEHGENALAAFDKRRSGRTHWHPPETLKRVFARQYKGVSQHARHLLELLAVAGRRVSVNTAGEMLDLPTAKTDACAIELVEKGLVRFENGRLTIKNELHQAYAVSCMSDDARRYFHALLAKHSADDPEERGVRVELERAYHLINAEMLEEAVDLVLQVADEAVANGAATEVEQLIELVLEVCGEHYRPELHLALAVALATQARHAAALSALETWEAAAQDAAAHAEAACLRTEILFRGGLGDQPAITASAATAVSTARKYGRNETLVRALQNQAEVAYAWVDFATLHSIAKEARITARSASDRTARAMAFMTQGYCHLVLREFEAAAGAFRESDYILADLDSKPTRRRALNGLGICLTGLGKFTEAETVLRLSTDCALQIDDPVAIANCLNNLGYLYMAKAMYARARECFREAIDRRSDIPSPHNLTNILTNAATLSLALGNRAEARNLVARALNAAKASNRWRDHVDYLAMHADLLLSGGRIDEALDLVDRIIGIMNASRQDSEFDVGRLARLRRLLVFSRSGYDEMVQFSKNSPLQYEKARLENRLEIECTEAWAAQQAGVGDDARRIRVLDEIRTAGLYGLLAQLRVLRVTPFELDAQPGETSAQMVARIFLHQSPDQVPDSVF